MAEKSEGKETSNVLPKSWTNPFAKKANFSTFNYQLICSVEKVFCVKNVSKPSFKKLKGEKTR